MCFSINNVVFYQTISALDHKKCCLTELPVKKRGLKVPKSVSKNEKNSVDFLKKVTVWGCSVSSQNTIERLLNMSSSSKSTLKQKKFKMLIFQHISDIQDFLPYEFFMGIAVLYVAFLLVFYEPLFKINFISESNMCQSSSKNIILTTFWPQ